MLYTVTTMSMNLIQTEYTQKQKLTNAKECLSCPHLKNKMFKFFRLIVYLWSLVTCFKYHRKFVKQWNGEGQDVKKLKNKFNLILPMW